MTPHEAATELRIARTYELEASGGIETPLAEALALAIERLSTNGAIGAFIRDRCDVAPGRLVECGALFRAWCEWATAAGGSAGSTQSFGRDLGNAVPDLRTRQFRGARGERSRFYEGIGLR